MISSILNMYYQRYIVKALNSVRSNAKGIDLIPVTFLKLCMPSLLPVLELNIYLTYI